MRFPKRDYPLLVRALVLAEADYLLRAETAIVSTLTKELYREKARTAKRYYEVLQAAIDGRKLVKNT